MRTVPPVSPGEMLDEKFLKPRGLTTYRLAKHIGVPPQCIGDIVAGKRAITAPTCGTGVREPRGGAIDVGIDMLAIKLPLGIDRTGR